MKLFGILTVWVTFIGLAVPANGGLAPACCACRPNVDDAISQCLIVPNEDEFRVECEGQNAKAFCINEFAGSLEECVEMISENPLITCANTSDSVAAPAVSTPIAIAMAAALAFLGFALTRRRHSA